MKVQPYQNLRQRIHNSAREKGFPLRVMFELTYRCNFFCRHCYVPFGYRKKKELKTRQVFSVIDQLADIGCFYLGFTGGEPFVRKDILDILWHAQKKGFEIIVYTNGSLIDKKIAKELGRIRPNKVDITIPAVSEGAFERVTQLRGSQKRVFKAVNLLRKERVALGFKTCLLKENEAEIQEIQDFAASLGALHRLDTMLSPRLDGSRQPYRYRGSLKIPGQEQTENCDSVGERLAVSGFRLSQHQAPSTKHPAPLFKCGAGLTQAAITPQGKLKMCLMIDYPLFPVVGTQRKPNLQNAWNRLKKLVASIKPDKDYKCDTCALEPYCKWCPAAGWLYSRSFVACDPERRRQAELLMTRSCFT